MFNKSKTLPDKFFNYFLHVAANAMQPAKPIYHIPLVFSSSDDHGLKAHLVGELNGQMPKSANPEYRRY